MHMLAVSQNDSFEEYSFKTGVNNLFFTSRILYLCLYTYVHHKHKLNGLNSYSYVHYFSVYVVSKVNITTCVYTIRCKILTGENVDEFDEFPAIRQYFPYQNFSFS